MNKKIFIIGAIFFLTLIATFFYVNPQLLQGDTTLDLNKLIKIEGQLKTNNQKEKVVEKKKGQNPNKVEEENVVLDYTPDYLVLGSGDPGLYVARAISTILIISGILAVILIIVSGIRYIMSYGKDENIEAAKKMLMWTIVGLVAIILSYLIVQTIMYYFFQDLLYG